MMPVDHSLSLRPMFTRMKKVTLSDLMNESIQESTNMTELFFDGQLLRVITPTLNQNATVNFRRNKTNAQQLSYNRFLQVSFSNKNK